MLLTSNPLHNNLLHRTEIVNQIGKLCNAINEA
jgi:hypothetical protein